MMRRIFPVVFVLATVTAAGVTLSLTATPVTAADDDGLFPPMDSVFNKTESCLDNTEVCDDAMSGWLDRQSASFDLGGFFGGSDDAQAQAADEMTQVVSELRTNKSAWKRYFNARETFSSGEDTASLTIRINGERVTRYVVANVSDGAIQSYNVTASTTRTVDHPTTLCGYTAKHAAEEIRSFRTEHVVPNTSPSREYLAHIKAEYGPDVETTLVTSDGTC